MTLVSDILAAAYRESNLLPVATAPNTNLTTEALALLNTIVISSIGNEVGDPLRDMNIGGTYDETRFTVNWVPNNARLVLNLSAAATLYLDPEPYTGQMLAISDAAGNLGTYNLTLNGNGRKIEGASTLILNTNSDSRQWFYRGDTSTWTKLATLLSSDQMPFPPEFDDYFITALALRLNPRYSQTVAAETTAAFNRARRNIRARYRDRSATYPEYMGRLGEKRQYLYFNDGSDFKTGRLSF